MEWTRVLIVIAIAIAIAIAEWLLLVCNFLVVVLCCGCCWFQWERVRIWKSPMVDWLAWSLLVQVYENSTEVCSTPRVEPVTTRYNFVKYRPKVDIFCPPRSKWFEIWITYLGYLTTKWQNPRWGRQHSCVLEYYIPFEDLPLDPIRGLAAIATTVLYSSNDSFNA
jgi:hypothetical protein